MAYVNGGMDARSNPEGNAPERKDEYGASPISLDRVRTGCQNRANSERSLRAVKRIQKTFFFEPLTSVLEPFNGTV